MIVSDGQQRDSAIHTRVSILPQTPLPSRLPHNIEQELSVPYSRSLLLMHFKYSSVYLSIPNSLTIPPTLPPATVSSLSLCVCLCFVHKISSPFLILINIVTIFYYTANRYPFGGGDIKMQISRRKWGGLEREVEK